MYGRCTGDVREMYGRCTGDVPSRTSTSHPIYISRPIQVGPLHRQAYAKRVPCVCPTCAIPVPCLCHACAMRVPCVCHACTMRVPCVYHACAMRVPCVCHASAMRQPCVCHASAMRLPCVCRACATQVPRSWIRQLNQADPEAVYLSRRCRVLVRRRGCGGQYGMITDIRRHRGVNTSIAQVWHTSTSMTPFLSCGSALRISSLAYISYIDCHTGHDGPTCHTTLPAQ